MFAETSLNMKPDRVSVKMDLNTHRASPAFFYSKVMCLLRLWSDIRLCLNSLPGHLAYYRYIGPQLSSEIVNISHIKHTLMQCDTESKMLKAKMLSAES